MKLYYQHNEFFKLNRAIVTEEQMKVAHVELVEGYKADRRNFFSVEYMAEKSFIEYDLNNQNDVAELVMMVAGEKLNASVEAFAALYIATMKIAQ